MNRLSGLGHIIQTLRNPNFGIYTAGNSVSLIGTWMQRVATGWLTWELTGSGAWLGLITFADLFPTIIIGPIAGAAADRWDRLRINKVTQALSLAQAVALFFLTVAGGMTIHVLLALTLFLGVVDAFNQPARLAIVNSLVPRANLSSAVAIGSLVFNLARFIGPAIAGLMIVQWGVSGVFAANVVSTAVFLFALTRVRMAAPALRSGAQTGFLAELVQGVRYTMAHTGIGPMLLLMLAASLGCRPIVELLPGFAAEVFASGAAGLAVLTSAIGLGAIIGGFWLGGRGSSGGLVRVVLASSLLLAVAASIFTASDNLWIAVPALVGVGFCMSATGIGVQTLIHLNAADAVRARVLSIHGLIFRGGPALGALAMGIASEVVGLRWPVFIGTLVSVAAWSWTYLRRRRIAEALQGT